MGWIRGALLVALLPGFLACAGGAPTPTTPAAPASPGQSGLAGQVVAASDVAGRPDTPLPAQLVLAVPAEQAGALLGASGQAPADEELRFLRAEIPTPDPAIASAVSDASGWYALALAPGAYVVCVADTEQQPPAFPATTRGCGRTEVPPGTVRRVDISSGFGEILLMER